VSTILDALRKLQRERTAQGPAKDLRGSITTETPLQRRGRQGGAVSRWIVATLVLLGVASGGYGLYRSGLVHGLLGRFSQKTSASQESLAEPELAVAERDGGAQGQPAPQAAAPPPAITPTPRARGARLGSPPASPESEPPPARVDTSETVAERARLEAALVNARAAQEAKRQADLDAAAQQAAATPPPPAPAIPFSPPAASPPAASPPAPLPAVPVAAVKPKPTVRVAAVKPKPAAATPIARPTPQRTAAAAPPSSAFPDVRVESIRWHPVAARRVAGLHFEQQDVPEAREGDIVAGVLVYRINPGSVELRVGSAQRTVSPGP
jgi:hypothetical protein